MIRDLLQDVRRLIRHDRFEMHTPSTDRRAILLGQLPLGTLDHQVIAADREGVCNAAAEGGARQEVLAEFGAMAEFWHVVSSQGASWGGRIFEVTQSAGRAQAPTDADLGVRKMILASAGSNSEIATCRGGSDAARIRYVSRLDLLTKEPMISVANGQAMAANREPGMMVRLRTACGLGFGGGSGCRPESSRGPRCSKPRAWPSWPDFT